MLLKVGRHLRPAPNYKLIVGREEGENNFLGGYRHQFLHLRMVSHDGPLTLIDGSPDAADLTLAARIAARYSQGRDAAEVRVDACHVDGVTEQFVVAPLAPWEVDPRWHIGT